MSEDPCEPKRARVEGEEAASPGSAVAKRPKGDEVDLLQRGSVKRIMKLDGDVKNIQVCAAIILVLLQISMFFFTTEHALATVLSL